MTDKSKTINEHNDLTNNDTNKNEILLLLNEFLCQKNIFVILFNLDGLILFQNIPGKGEVSIFSDFIFLFGESHLKLIFKKIKNPIFSNYSFTYRELQFELKRMRMGLFVLEIYSEEEGSLKHEKYSKNSYEAEIKEMDEIQVFLREIKELDLDNSSDRIKQEYLPRLNYYNNNINFLLRDNFFQFYSQAK